MSSFAINAPSGSSSRGLLLVTMEPPATFEDEFNDWYDSEHFPQRRALPGFDSGSRWVCVDGWPRYLALYDLASPSALETDAYRAVAGTNATPWSRRILARTLGRMRVVATQIAPGTAVTGSGQATARLALARFRLPSRGADEFAAAWTTAMAALPHLRQARLFRSNDEAGDLWVIAELGAPITPAALVAGMAEIAGVGADLFNLYVPYWRA
jgi:hypothetical protein